MISLGQQSIRGAAIVVICSFSFLACSNDLEYTPGQATVSQPSGAREGNNEDATEGSNRERRSDNSQSDSEQQLNQDGDEMSSEAPSPSPVEPPQEDPQELARMGLALYQDLGCTGCHNAVPSTENRLVNKTAEQILAASSIRRHSNLVNNNMWPDNEEARLIAEAFKAEL